MRSPSKPIRRVAPILFALAAILPLALPAQTKPAVKKKAAPAAPVARAPAGSLGLKLSADWALEDEEGKPMSLGSMISPSKPALILFLSARDPATNAYADRIAALQREFGGKISIVGLSVNPGEPLSELHEIADKCDWGFPIGRDAGRQVTRGLRATITPQAMLLDSKGVVRYSGPIDDAWVDARKVRDPVLKNAIEAMLRGAKISNPEPAYYYGMRIKS